MRRMQKMVGLLVVVALLVASAPALVRGGGSAAVASANGVPHGQLTRRGLSGRVASVGGGSLGVQTNFGVVTVGISGAVIRARGIEDFTAADIQVGDRVAILLDRPPVDPASLEPDGGDGEPTATPTDGTSATSTPTGGGDTSATSTPANGGDATATPTATTEPGTSATSTPVNGGAEPTPEPTAEPTATPSPTPTTVPTPAPTPTQEPTPAPTPTQEPGSDQGGSATSTPVAPGETPEPPSSTSTPVSGGDDGGASATSTPVVEPTPVPTSISPGNSQKTLPTVVIRSVNAIRVTVVPANPLRTHVRGVVGEKGNGRVKLWKKNGEEEEVDWDGQGSDVGSDVILIAQRGQGGGRKQVSATSTPDVISDRLARLQEKAEERQDALAEKLAEMKAAQEEKRLERLETARGKAPEDVKDKINQHIDRARGRSGGSNAGGGSSGGGSSGGGNSGGGNSGGGGGSSGGGNSGGGNSGGGSSGGGGGKKK